MKLKEYSVLNKWIPREQLTEVVILTNKLKEQESQCNNDYQHVSIKISKYIFDNFMTGVKMLDEIDFFNKDFINNVEFKIK